jgi:hypothetical protein
MAGKRKKTIMSTLPKTDGRMRRDDDAEVSLWELQPWDTSVSFDRFRNFYLTQEPPRSLVVAYRRYRSSRGASDEQVQRIRAAPGTWKNWAYGRDSKGRLIPTALTWAGRARAYDVDLADRRLREDEEKWEKRRTALREADWNAGEALRDRAKRMLLGMLFGKKTEEIATKDGQTLITQVIYEPTKWTERDIMTAFKLASDLQRRGAGEPPNNPATKNDWRDEAQRAGFDPDLVRDYLMKFLAGDFDVKGDENEI